MNLADLQSQLTALHFLRPQWLWLLLALPMLAWAWRARRQRQSAWRSAVDAHLLPHLLERGGGARRSLAPWLVALGFALGVCALAGPSWRKGEQPLLQGKAPLAIALDLSSATLAGDLPPSRLLQARAKLATLLHRRAGGQVGLVAFADDAYTVAPLTDDAANVALYLDALTPDIMPIDGSNAARAIDRSARLLKQAGFAQGDILLLSDHADAAARRAAADAHRDGYRVSALGLGTGTGAAYRTPDGAIANARLDAGSLRALASAGGGRYSALTPGTRDLVSLDVLDASSLQQASSADGEKAAVWRDDGYWLLLPLMLLALFAFRRGGVFAALLLCAFLPWQPARAAGNSDATLWRRADQLQHRQMQRGADAYRKQDYAAAAQTWQSLPGADAAYNRGNALAEAGRYEDAIAAYDRALQLRPAMADAIANKKAVEDAMKRKPPPSPKQNSRGKQKPSDGGKPNQGKQNPQDSDQSPSGKSQGDDAGKENRNPSGKPPEQAPPRTPSDQSQQQQKAAEPPKPDDADAQHKADAEQRARMQRALRRNPQGQQRDANGEPVDKGRPIRVESAAEREKRAANEAWLRRVPDDPGGLLRAKFRLEYERRQQNGER